MLCIPHLSDFGPLTFKLLPLLLKDYRPPPCRLLAPSYVPFLAISALLGVPLKIVFSPLGLRENSPKDPFKL